MQEQLQVRQIYTGVMRRPAAAACAEKPMAHSRYDINLQSTGASAIAKKCKKEVLSD